MPRVKVFGISVNPGPFTVKEHVLVTIMGSVGVQSAYATDIIAVQRVFYNQVHNFAYQWMIVMSTQLIGFSIGGIARRFLVSPPSMIWPANLVLCALFNTLHSQNYAGVGTRGGMSRERFFVCTLAPAAFVAVSCSPICRRIRCWHDLVPVPRVPLPGSQLLQLGLLDRPRQHSRQPDVRIQPVS
jgi:hypothetical protein